MYSRQTAAFACIFEELSGTGADFCYNYSASNLVNCLLIRNRSFRRYLGKTMNKNNIFVGCYDTTSTYSNLYQTETTGTSAGYRVNLNNVFDLPISQCRNFQTAINNNRVAGKYMICEENIFNMKLSAMNFVDPDNHDFRLRSDSPLLSAGSILSDFTLATADWIKTYPVNQRDLMEHNYKSPNPSIGPLQYYPPAEGKIPNYSYPMGK